MLERTFKGLTLRVNPIFFALFPASAILGFSVELYTLLLSALFHEAAHMLTGFLSGLHMERLEITIIGLSARMSGMDFISSVKKYGIFLSGPVISLVIAITALLLKHEFIFSIHAALFIFNMLPARTLDGGQFLITFIARRSGFINASRVMNRINRVVCFFLIAGGIVQIILYPPNLSLLLLGVFLLWQGKHNSTAECLRFTYNIIYTNNKYASRRLSVRCFAFAAETSLKALFDCLNYDTLTMFYIYDTSYITTIHTEQEFIQNIKENGISRNAGELFDKIIT